MGDYLRFIGMLILAFFIGIPILALKMAGIIVLIFSGGVAGWYVSSWLDSQFHIGVVTWFAGIVVAVICYGTIIYLQEEYEFFSFLSLDFD